MHQTHALVLVAAALLALCAPQAAGRRTRADFAGPISAVSELPLNEDNTRLARHVMIVAERCVDEVIAGLGDESTAERDLVMVSPALEAHFHVDGACPSITCLEQGTKVELLPYWYQSWPKAAGVDVSQEDLDGMSLSNFVRQECQRMEVAWVNYRTKPIDLYWVSNGQEFHQAKLPRGERHTQWRISFLGHLFRVRDSETQELIADYPVLRDQFNVVGRDEDPPKQIGEMELSFEDANARVRPNEIRRSNRVKRTFTEHGYKKERIPSRLWGTIETYWHNNRFNNVTEEWGRNKGVFINWWEVDALIVVPPWGRKGRWHKLLMPHLEAWSKEDLEPTDLYGIRTYQTGSYLIDHVDREDTHAVSAIMNVDQDIDEDWELEIFNLDGEMKRVAMQPGEMVFYESAKCMHGRPDPIVGRYYTNCFFHYRPVGNPKWWQEERENRHDEL